MGRPVKSAVRVLEIFELFDRLQREATVGEIARTLGYPKSSTSVLLNSLAELGYLYHGSSQRSYLPTPRVSLLGSWVAPMLSPGGDVLLAMAELGERTGETIILAAPTRDQIQYIHVVPATATMRLPVGPGTTRPMLTSGIGRLLLSVKADEEIAQMVYRHNSGPGADGARVSLAAVRRDLALIRAQGYALFYKGVTPGAAVLGMLLPFDVGGVRLAIGIGGWARTVRAHQDTYVTLLRSTIERRLGTTERRSAA
ncbi:MAG: IclR family transcriptional regulator [Lautropia sp.]